MEKEPANEIILQNLRKIMSDRRITQAAMAEMIDTTPSQFSKILKGTVQLSLIQLSKLASKLSLREIDIFTYPDVYIKPTQDQEEPVEAILQIRLQKDRRDQVLKLVFGDNNLEILNK